MLPPTSGALSQVANRNLLFANPLPGGQAVALHTQTARLVRAAGGAAVAPSEVYLHHFVTINTLLVPPPTGQGSIVRRAFPAPYGIVVAADQLTPPVTRYT